MSKNLDVSILPLRINPLYDIEKDLCDEVDQLLQ